MEIVTNLDLLVPLAFGISWVLREIKNVIIILQKAKELKVMKIKKEIIESIIKEADDQREKIADSAAEKIKKKFLAGPEETTAVKKALLLIIEFIENGGQLDINLKKEVASDSDSDESDEGDTIEIKGFIENIQKDIKLLKTPDEGEIDGVNND